MPLFLAVRQSSKPTNSPQSQNTCFHEQRDALFFNVSPYVTERDAHISFPEANKEKKAPVMFSRDAGCESGAHLQ